MKFGVVLPHTGHAASLQAIRDVAQAAESLGFASLWVGEHIILPDQQATPYPYNQGGAYPVPPDRVFLESFTTLAYTAAVAQKADLGISVCILPYRRPLILTKVVNTVDFLCGGRLILGVGAGWLREEFAALGISFNDRDELTDEVIQLLRKAWQTEEAVTFEGKHIHVKGVHVHPRPVHGSIPVWVGGRSRISRTRAARFGTAWHPPLWRSEPTWLKKEFAEINRQSEAFGRGFGSLELTLWAPLRFASETADEAPWTTGLLSGTPPFVASVLQEYAAAGVSHLVFAIGGSVDTRIRTMQLIAQEVSQEMKAL